MTRDELMLKLTEIEFMAIDMQLYLDTHPYDKRAIEQYNAFTSEAAKLRTEYEKQFGPLFSYISMSDADKFKWIEEPFPWEKEANPKL